MVYLYTVVRIEVTPLSICPSPSQVLALTKTSSYARSVRVNIIRHLMHQSRLGQMYEEGWMEVVDDTTQQQETTQDGGNEEEVELEDR